MLAFVVLVGGAQAAYAVGPQTSFVVTNNNDSTNGNAANCLTATLTATSCGFRDALAAATAATGSATTITFSSNLIGTSTIQATAAHGPFVISGSNVTVNGLTGGTGASLGNYVSLTGGTLTQVISVPAGSVATLNNLNISNGSSATASGGCIGNAGTLTVNQSSVVLCAATNYNDGGGIYSSGVLTVSNSTISGNSASTGPNRGGGIFSSITATSLTVTNSTISGNSAYSGGGIAVYGGTLSLSHVTISGNTASGIGGGLFTFATPALVGNLIAGNSATVSNADAYPAISSLPAGNLIYSGSATTTPLAYQPNLSYLYFYGGPTQTMLALPGVIAGDTTAFCFTQRASTGADQRGLTGSTYGSLACTDAGATQSSYTIGYGKQPAGPFNQNAVMGTGAPVVAFYDHGSQIATVLGSVVFTDADNVIAGTTSAPFGSNATASPTAASFTTAETGDTLTGTYTLTLPNAATVALSTGASSAFNVVAIAPTQIVLGALSTTTAGSSPGTATATLELGSNVTATNSSASVTFTLSGPTGYTTSTTSSSASAGIATQLLPTLAIPGTYSLTASTTSPVLKSNTVSFSVAQLKPLLTLSATSPLLAGASLASLTASAVYNGSPVAGSFAYLATPSGGTAVAVTQTTVLAAGSYIITALFTPSNATAYLSASGTIAISVADFTFSDSTTTGTTTLPTNRGGTVTDIYTFKPAGVTTFPAAITLTVTGAPSTITVTMSPGTLAPGFSSTSSTLTAAVATNFVLNRHDDPLHRARPSVYGEAPFALALLLLPFAGRLRKAGRGVMSLSLLLALSVAAMASMTGCSNTGKAPEFVPLTITATSGTLSHSVTVNVLVQ